MGRAHDPFFFSPIGWEVVQSVGHQPLELTILVRVQASQPISLEEIRRCNSGRVIGSTRSLLAGEQTTRPGPARDARRPRTRCRDRISTCAAGLPLSAVAPNSSEVEEIESGGESAASMVRTQACETTIVPCWRSRPAAWGPASARLSAEQHGSTRGKSFQQQLPYAACVFLRGAWAGMTFFISTSRTPPISVALASSGITAVGKSTER
jgi:hypothetical protein